MWRGVEPALTRQPREKEKEQYTKDGRERGLNCILYFMKTLINTNVSGHSPQNILRKAGQVKVGLAH